MRLDTLPAGIGLRAAHHAAVAASRPPVGFLEIHAENYLGPQRRVLETLRKDYPISVHAVGLSLGSADGVDAGHLERVAALVDAIDPLLVSEHLSWSVARGAYHNDLLPLPYTEESLAVVARNIERVQDRLGRSVLIENPSTYLRYAHSTIPEAEFLAWLAGRTGCGILLDVNNAYVSAVNHETDPVALIEAIPASAVGEMHLAGHHVSQEDGVTILIDDHGSQVADPVWRLYERAVHRFAAAPTLIEWDSNIPVLNVLAAEAQRADRRRARAIERQGHVLAA